jgi:hypothetical protein
MSTLQRMSTLERNSGFFQDAHLPADEHLDEHLVHLDEHLGHQGAALTSASPVEPDPVPMTRKVAHPQASASIAFFEFHKSM